MAEAVGTDYTRTIKYGSMSDNTKFSRAPVATVKPYKKGQSMRDDTFASGTGHAPIQYGSMVEEPVQVTNSKGAYYAIKLDELDKQKIQAAAISPNVTDKVLERFATQSMFTELTDVGPEPLRFGSMKT